MFGICLLSVVPCRKEASHKSEMVTQLLFGDVFSILESCEGWVQVQVHFDGYVGWVDHNQVTRISADYFNLLENEGIISYCGTPSTHLTVSSVKSNAIIGRQSVLIGSRFPLLKDGAFVVNDFNYSLDKDLPAAASLVVQPSASPLSREGIVRCAMQFVSTPYLWGGKSFYGIDCSGFSQLVFKLNGIALKRDAYQQVTQGSEVLSLEEANGGDLAFFTNATGAVVHVGIIIDKGHIIHASGKVRIDQLTATGIFNADTQLYSHRLFAIRSYC